MCVCDFILCPVRLDDLITYWCAFIIISLWFGFFKLFIYLLAVTRGLGLFCRAVRLFVFRSWL